MIEIENKNGKVKLNDVVTKESIGKMIDEIGRLFGATAVSNGADFGEITNIAENAVDTLEIEINSPGGSVFDGYTIYQEIKSLQDRGVVVNGTITGLAASMASVIAMACDKINIVPHGRMMIHDASNIVRGNAEQLRQSADLLDSISEDIATIYANRTGSPVDQMRDLMKKETWMNSQECVDGGFVDEILLPVRKDSKNLTENVIDESNKKDDISTMSILSRLFPDNAQVEQIEAQIAENESLRKEIEEMTAQIEEVGDLKNQILSSNLQIEELEAKIEESNAKKEQAEVELQEAQAKVTEEAVQALVTEELAKCSHQPIEASASEEEETLAKEISRDQFNALSPFKKSQFCLSGGKIKEA